MASRRTMIHVRIDEQVKTEATETLAAMGLSISDAVRVFLKRVVCRQTTSVRAQGAQRHHPSGQARSRRDCSDQRCLKGAMTRFFQSIALSDTIFL